MPDAQKDAVDFLLENKDFFLAYLQDSQGFLEWGVRTLDAEDQKKASIIRTKMYTLQVIGGKSLSEALASGEEELNTFLSSATYRINTLITAVEKIKEECGGVIAKWYDQKNLDNLKQEIRAEAAKNPGGVTPIIEQLFSEMEKNPEDNKQQMEILDIVKNALAVPSPDNISKLAAHADKQQTSIESVKKVIAGLLFCLAGVLTTALAVAFTGVTTAFSLGASAPLSIPAGIGIASAGVGLLATGSALVYSGAQKKESTVTQLYKEVLKQQKTEDAQTVSKGEEVDLGQKKSLS